MGYDLHITRAPQWAENTGFEIPSDEWLEVVRQDPELTPDPTHGPNSASWTAGEGWLDWYEGNVFTTDPSAALYGKMLTLAAALSARVQGDDGEVYERAGEWRAKT